MKSLSKYIHSHTRKCIWKCLESGLNVIYKVIVVCMLRDQIHGWWILACWSYVWRLYKNQFVETGTPLLNILPAARYHSYVNSSVIRDMNRQHSKHIWKCRRNLNCGHGSIPIICRDFSSLLIQTYLFHVVGAKHSNWFVVILSS